LAEMGDDGPVGAPDLIVDALFGTGLTRPLPDKVAQVLAGIDQWRARQMGNPLVVAVDMPSGLCADTGRMLGQGLKAGLTVSFHAPKLGHYLGQGPRMCGDLVVADIGLPPRPRFELAPAGIVHAALPEVARLRKGQGHKFDHGHALILSGGVGKGGAARLAARAALRVGAGLVTLACPPAALIENAARLDAIMLFALRGAQDLVDRLGDARIRALCLGPGLGLDARARALVGAALDTPDPAPGHARPRLKVLDADALTLIAQDEGLRRLLTPDCVLTPHMGEFARLAPDLAARADLPAVEAARIAAERLGTTIVLKGPVSVIAAPGGPVWINAAVYARSVPWLATAGAGDVLAGMIAGLGARGFDAAGAAMNAVWLHAEAARVIGPGLIAEDIPEALPRVFRSLFGADS
jgi:ADP-dependent NAD(P)H-hydrate dehydratase / NAD(P)H-hydrate epimerase